MTNFIGIVKYIFAAFLCIFALFSTAQAEEEDPKEGHPVDTCLARTLPPLWAKGVHLRLRRERGFLLDGESRSFAMPLREDGCIGVFASGAHRKGDIDLGLYSEEGVELARAQEESRYEYVHYCGKKNASMRVVVTMNGGQGEFRLIVLDRAPPTLDELATQVGRCFPPRGGRLERPIDVGPEPRFDSVQTVLRSWERRLAEEGYVPSAEPFSGQIESQGLDVRLFPVQANRCYAFLAAAGPGVHDVDLLIRQKDGQLVTGDATRERDALAKLCAPAAGNYVLETHIYSGEGEYSLQVYELKEIAINPHPVGIEGVSLITYAELLSSLQRRGMRADVLAWGYLWPDALLNMPVYLEAGRCYAFAAVVSPELAASDVDLSLLKEGGQLAAWDVDVSETPRVYHCPKESGRYELVSRVFGGRGRYLVMMGQDRE